MTNIPLREITTSKTDKTNKVTNTEFLSTVFGNSTKGINPIVVSFKENPQTAPKKFWFGKVWSPDNPELPIDTNNYFSLASFRPNEAGEYRRQKKQFVNLHAIMLDDIGTKVDKERITLPPSWLIETSSGNYQAGYILEKPIGDSTLADKLMKAIVSANLCDPGAGGPTARLARLPTAINGKTEPVFHCNMEEWNPELRYSIETIVNELQLDMQASERPKANKRQSSSNEQSLDEIHSPAPEQNTIIETLKAKHLYKSPLGGGKHDLTCPWKYEHTDNVDGGTAYFEPNDTYPIGGFKCFHGHCEHRKIRDFLETLSIEVSQAYMKPTIRSIAGEIHRIVDKAEYELAQSGRYYQRGGIIVTINTDPSTRETLIKEVSQPSLTAALSNVALWERYDKRSNGQVRIDPPVRAISVLYDATGYNHLPVLNGIAHQPYLREDGTLAKNSGYDAATGMFGIFNIEHFTIPDKPTKEDAENALDTISGLLSEFSFQKESDKASALTAILTAAIRPSLTVAPMYHARAPQISSGKSFLCQIISAFASSKHGSPTTFPHDDEECRKVLLAELLKGPAVIEFDNLTSDLVAHKSLCTALTSEFMSGRILGVSKTATVSTRTLFLSSGNNVGPIQDMVRRCITINLDPACENPASRTFKNPHLLSDIQKSRSKYVSAALTIIRAWIIAGQPKSECKTLASYEQWSNFCRQPLMWLGLPDPTESLFESMNEDPERETLGRLLYSWDKCFGSKATMVREAVNLTMQSNCSSYVNELSEVLNDISADRNGINRRALGHWIKRNANKIVNGKRFIRGSGSLSAATWKAESVLSVLSEF